MPSVYQEYSLNISTRTESQLKKISTREKRTHYLEYENKKRRKYRLFTSPSLVSDEGWVIQQNGLNLRIKVCKSHKMCPSIIYS